MTLTNTAPPPDPSPDPPQRIVYFNGKYVPESEARISIYDSALMFGDMAFEFTRTFAHQPFRLKQHLERIEASMKILRIDCGMRIEQLEQVTLEVVQRNVVDMAPDLDVQILHDISRGILGPYRRVFDPDSAAGPTVIIAVYPLDLHLAEMAPLYDSGIRMVIPPQRSIPPRLLDPKLKTRSRQHYMIADMQAHDVDRQAWALLVNEDGHITEGTGSNFFMVKDGVLWTPEPMGILRGVSRQMVLDLAKQLNIPCRQCPIEPYDVYHSDEAFLTSTRFCIMIIRQLDHIALSSGQPGPVAQQLLSAWSQNVGVDIVAQAKRYAQFVASGHSI